MPSLITRTPLGPSTLVRKWLLDVNTGTIAVPVWVGVFGIAEFKPTVDPTSQDDSDFDSAGWGSETVTALKWKCEGKVRRKVIAATPTVYDPGQEVLRAHSVLIGVANPINLRFYEWAGAGTPAVEAYQGNATVQWMPDGGNTEDVDTASFTLTGQGPRTAITHPSV